MNKMLLSIAGILIITGCAKRPEDIQPVAMSGNFDCQTERALLADLERQQRNARTGDTIGVLLVGIPVSSLSGSDLETQIAVAKGKVQACR